MRCLVQYMDTCLQERRAEMKALLALALLVALLAIGKSVHAYNLHDAPAAGDVARIQTMLKAGANVNAKNLDGETALHYAARKGHAAAIEVLLKAGANVNAKDKDGFKVLHYAEANGHAAAVRKAAEKVQGAKIAKEAAKRANAPTCDRLKTSVLRLLKKKRDVLKIYKVEDYTGKEMLAIERIFSEEPEKIPLLKQRCRAMGRQARGGIYGNKFEDHLDKKELKATRILCFRPTAQIENDTIILRLCKGTVRFPSNTRNIYFYSIKDVDGDVFTGYLYR